LLTRQFLPYAERGAVFSVSVAEDKFGSIEYNAVDAGSFTAVKRREIS
jgi:hypothetical protein